MTQIKLSAWLAGRIPGDWFTEPVEITTDRDEITIVGALEPPVLEDDADDEAVAVAARGRATQFREDTRARRMEIARELERLTQRKVSWGVTVGDHRIMFTTLAAPVMTRLRQQERQVLDTLIDAGVARSRSEALAWCVRLVAGKADTWLSELREAMKHVEEVRRQGPDVA